MQADKSERRATHSIDIAYLAPRVVWLVVFVVISSALDAFFTLLHIQQGGSEGNPLMAMALDQGTTWFVSFKMGLTGLGALLLAIHRHSWIGLKSLQFLACIYGGLLGYHGLIFFSDF